jgi:hypothetical protein
MKSGGNGLQLNGMPPFVRSSNADLAGSLAAKKTSTHDS